MYLEKNLKVLASRYPQYVELIRNAPSTGRYQINNGNLADMKAGALYYSGNPTASVTEELKRVIKLPNLTMFFGLGLGYHLRGLAQNVVDAVVVFEPDFELLKAVFTYVDLSVQLANPAVTYCFGNPAFFHPHVYQALLRGNAKYYLKSINFVPVGISYSLNKEYYSACMQVVKSATTAVLQFYGNDPADSLIGIHNTFINIDEIIEHPGIKDLKNAFKNKTGVVVATGPSLNKNIELLREISDRAVIIAVDASLRVMMARGIKPHMITSLERVLPTSKLVAGFTKEEVEDIYFAPCPVIHPQTYANWPGKKIVVYRDFATFKWLDIDKGQMTIGPSSGNMAYKLLEYMGCSHIILIGQDLAFEGELTHAKGATFGEVEGHMKKLKGIMVEGNYVPQIRTTPVWNQFRQFYENDILQYKGEVINATEGGAKIHGTTLMTFREAIDKYIDKKPINVLQTIEKRLSVPPPSRQQKLREDVLKKVNAALAYCDYAINFFTEGAAAASALLQEKTLEAQNKVESYLKIYSEPDFYLIMMHYVQSYFIKIIIDINGVKASDMDKDERYTQFGMLCADLNNTMKGLTYTMKQEFLNMKNHLESEMRER